MIYPFTLHVSNTWKLIEDVGYLHLVSPPATYFSCLFRHPLWVIPVPSSEVSGPHRHLASLHNKQRDKGNALVLQLNKSNGRLLPNAVVQLLIPHPEQGSHSPLLDLTPQQLWGELTQLDDLEEHCSSFLSSEG